MTNRLLPPFGRSAKSGPPRLIRGGFKTRRQGGQDGEFIGNSAVANWVKMGFETTSSN
jgi:hypothetical protein